MYASILKMTSKIYLEFSCQYSSDVWAANPTLFITQWYPGDSGHICFFNMTYYFSITRETKVIWWISIINGWLYTWCIPQCFPCIMDGFAVNQKILYLPEKSELTYDRKSWEAFY